MRGPSYVQQARRRWLLPMGATTGGARREGSQEVRNVLTSNHLAMAADKVDDVMHWAVGENESLTNAQNMAAAIERDIDKVEKAWPRARVKFSLPALHKFVDGVFKIPNAAVSAGQEMGNSWQNVFVAEQYFAAAKTLQNSIQRNLIPIITQAIKPAQDEAMRRGIPQSRWEEITIESPEIRERVLRVLRDTKGAWERYAFLEGIKPAIMRMPFMEWVIDGFRHVGAGMVAWHAAVGTTVDTTKDMIEAAGRGLELSWKLTQVALVGGAAFGLWWMWRETKLAQKGG